MIILGIPIFILITFVPGFLLVRLLRKELPLLDSILYALGLGLLFNIIIGLIANWFSDFNLYNVLIVYWYALVVLLFISWFLGKRIKVDWSKWKLAIIPMVLYLLALGLQLQTTLMSPNLIGSDIHLEYYVANLTLEQEFWNPAYIGTTLNACLGISVLLPFYKLVTGMELIWVFKIISPIIFAFLPLVIYRIFKMQFGTLVSVLAVLFFITMPMFTMDFVQLIRQQQAMLFFVLVVLVMMNNNLGILRKVILASLFIMGAIVTHLGIAIGIIGYLFVGLFCFSILYWWWKRRTVQTSKYLQRILVFVCLAVVSIGIYYGYYYRVNSGQMVTSLTIPAMIVGETMNPGSTQLSEPISDNETQIVTSKSFFERFPFLNPFFKEPLAQTAIGLDYSKASILGKIWRVLQYLVELCLIIGFIKLIFKPIKNLSIEYGTFIVSSFIILAAMYLLSSYGLGLGTVRIWGITLLFISPLFVIGASTIGQFIFRLKESNHSTVICSLILLVPYFIFNSGIVFELAKLEPKSFIDVPYSIPLSANRVDISSVFTNEDVEAMDYLKDIFAEDKNMIFTDTHGGNLMVQRIGMEVQTGDFKYLWQISENDIGYIFLRKWNVKNEEITLYGSYGTRESYEISKYPILESKIKNGQVVFDNGAKVIKIE